MTLRLTKIMIRGDDQESDMEYDRGSDKNSDQKKIIQDASFRLISYHVP